jgi:hypothetical protein
MSIPTRSRPILIGGFALLVLAAAIFLWPRAIQSPVEGRPQQQAVQSGDDTPREALRPEADTGDAERPRPRDRIDRLTESARRAPERFDEPGAVAPDVAMADYKADLWDEIRANPPVLKDLDDPDVDADLAYRIYTYYGNCSVIPRTERQVDRRLKRIAEQVEQFEGRPLDAMEGRVDRIMANYELCYLIPPEVDCRLEAVHWMTRAVELGHDVAEVQFYERAMGFLLRSDQLSNDPPLAMLEPGLVYQFKNTSRFGLVRAMEKGHPEAYLANAQALLEGLIYPKNPKEAFAHARAAELIAARHHLILEDLDYWKMASAKLLTDEELAEAEKIALELQSASRD